MPGADRGVLGLDERAELALGAQCRAGPQVGERTDGRAVTDRRLTAVGADHDGRFADGDVGQRGVRADLASPADARGAEQLCARVHDGVATDGHVDVDPRGGRVDDRHACALMGGDDAPVQLGAQLGQLHPVVDPGDQHGVVDVFGPHECGRRTARSR